MLNKLLTFIALLLIAGTVQAQTTRYISPTGSGTSCTISTPCALATAISQMSHPQDRNIFRGGHYYLSAPINPPISGSIVGSDTLRPSFEAYPGEKVIIDGLNVTINTAGSNVWTATSRSGVYRTPWLEAWGDISIPSGYQKFVTSGDEDYDYQSYRMNLVMDGRTSLYPPEDDATTWKTMTPGRFWVDNVVGTTVYPYHDQIDSIYVYLPDGSDPDKHRMQSSTLRHLFVGGNCYATTQDSLYTVKDLTFQHAANIRIESAVCLKSTNAENVTVVRTNATGITLEGSTVCTNCVGNYNGMVGIRGHHAINYKVIGGMAAYNNTKKYKTGHDSGGYKFTYSDNGVFLNCKSLNNYGPGIWLDLYNNYNTVNGCYVANNYQSGIFLENNTDFNIIINNIVTGTWYNANTGAFGVMVRESSDNLVAHNTMYANGGCVRIHWGPQDRGPTLRNGVYNNLCLNNPFPDPYTPKRQIEIHDDRDALGTVADMLTNKIDGNAYWPNGSTAFFRLRVDNTNTTYLHPQTDIAVWSGATGNDVNSYIISKAQPVVLDTLNTEKGLFLNANSQVKAKGTAIPTGWYDSTLPTTDYFGHARGTVLDIGAHQQTPIQFNVGSPTGRVEMRSDTLLVYSSSAGAVGAPQSNAVVSGRSFAATATLRTTILKVQNVRSNYSGGGLIASEGGATGRMFALQYSFIDPNRNVGCLRVIRRSAVGGSAAVVERVCNLRLPLQVRIVRSGAQFTGQYYRNGAWQSLTPVTINGLTGTLTAGRFATSGKAGETIVYFK